MSLKDNMKLRFESYKHINLLYVYDYALFTEYAELKRLDKHNMIEFIQDERAKIKLALEQLKDIEIMSKEL